MEEVGIFYGNLVFFMAIWSIFIKKIWQPWCRKCAEKSTLYPGANPTIISYNASVVKIYETTSSLVRFETKNIFFHFEKRASLLHTTLALYVVVNSQVIGLAPGKLASKQQQV
jgi:hypothetical protein